MEFIKHFISSNDAEIDVSQIGGEQRFTFEYGDIVEVVSPSNNELHEMTFYINYIDSQKIQLLNVATGVFQDLNITEDGFLTTNQLLVFIC